MVYKAIVGSKPNHRMLSVTYGVGGRGAKAKNSRSPTK